MRNKGFTLIELLIVVAIIGILAAVGAAVIPGLLENTKKNATKANHQTTVNYISVQLHKCYIGEDYVMNGNLKCSDRLAAVDGKVGLGVVNAAIKSLSDIKNPYKNHKQAVENSKYPANDGDIGSVCVDVSGTTITVITCFVSDCTNSSNHMSNTITIE